MLGWVTVVAYILCATLCFWAGTRRQLIIYRRNEIDTNPKAFWLSLGVLLITLGINKQLDLQTWFTQFGRDLAVQQGWFEARRLAQFGFIITLGIVAVLLLTVLIRHLRLATNYVKLALSGCTLLFIFILLRASSFHHIDELLDITFAEARINWILELGSLTIISVAAAMTIASSKLSSQYD